MKVDVSFRKSVHPSYPVVDTTLELDGHTVALLVIDMQNTFVHPKGSFATRGVDVSLAQQIIPPIAQLASACRKKGIRVIYAQHTFRPDFGDRSDMFLELMHSRQIGPVSAEKATVVARQTGTALVRDTWNSAIVDDLRPQPGDIVIDSKHLFSCFYQTDLDLVLKALGTETIFFTGVTTAICVESSIRDAFHRDFRCILVDDCTWERLPDMEAASKMVISMSFGYLTSSPALLRALTAED
jgi:ureidoacrylate peracid hydrolase